MFPVDLKGRGEGRAVEARAVMQVQQARTVLEKLIPSLSSSVELRKAICEASSDNSQGTPTSFRALSDEATYPIPSFLPPNYPPRNKRRFMGTDTIEWYLMWRNRLDE